jgi:hypothetical protein
MILNEKVLKYKRIGLLSNIIFEKWTVTEDSFLSWRDTMFNCEKLSWRSVCQLTMAQKNLVEERNDDGSFTKISKRRVKDLLNTVQSIQSKDDEKRQLEEVEHVFKEHLGLTTKLFAHYAGDAGSSSTMNRSEFSRFIKDSKIKKCSSTSGGSNSSKDDLTSASIDLIFARVNAPVLDMGSMIKLKEKAKVARENVQSSLNELDLPVAQEANGTDDDDEEENYEEDDNDKEIVPQEFIEALLRLSVAKYNTKTKSKHLTMGNRLEYLYETLLSPLSSNVSDAVTFRLMMTDEMVQAVSIYDTYAFLSCARLFFDNSFFTNKKHSSVKVYKKKRKKLKLLFLFYSAKDDSDDAIANVDTMNMKECIQMCRDLSFNVPDRHISRLFACVQGDEDDNNEETTMLEEKGELTYTEFLEFLSAISVWKNSDPYIPLSKKLNDFLVDTINKHEDVNNISITASKRLRKKSIN